MKKKLMGTLLAATLSLGGGLAQASAILGWGGSIYATGGNVSVDILPSYSGFDNLIELFYGYTDANHDITDKTFIGIDNHLGTVNLGTFQAGKELVFGIVSPQGTFLLGSGARNGDGQIHGWVSPTTIGAGFAESWDVGFEDLWNLGDRDFNDAMFRVNQTAVPEPATIGLLAAGLLGLGLSRRRQRG